MSVETVTRRKDGGQNGDKIRVKSKHCDDQPPCSNWIVSGLGSANPLGYRCIIQAAEKFADPRSDLLPVSQTIHIATFLACRPLSPGATKRCRSTPYFFATLCHIFCGSPFLFFKFYLTQPRCGLVLTSYYAGSV